MVIEKYKDEDKKYIQDICISTSSKASIDPIHREFTLNMYCNEYLEHELVLVLKDQYPVGYIMCATDYETYNQNMAPYSQLIKNLGNYYQERLEADINSYARFASDYPAHLHIDIHKDYQGGGNGSSLMNALLEELKKRHIKGIMLGVSKDNERAIGFYKKYQFKIIEEEKDGYTLGLKL